MLMAGYSKQAPKIKTPQKQSGIKKVKIIKKYKINDKNKLKKSEKQEKHIKEAKTSAKLEKKKTKHQTKNNKESVEKQPNEYLKIIDEIVADPDFSNYIARNVGKKAIDVISSLHEPISDEDLANKLNIKINEVRRILNTLNTYGITKYDTLKDKNGWLTFKWYVNFKNIENVKRSILENTKVYKYKLPENCNDFFICDTCFEKRKILFPFDDAVEMKFKCDCGGNLVRISKEEAQKLVEENNVIAH